MADLARYLNTVGGRRVAATAGATFESYNPYSGAPWALIPRCSAADIGAAVDAARSAF
jgi:(Z)-2-((N-methylformamido)methylene)-5-hydroxybutyrolactone dehydrogenase